MGEKNIEKRDIESKFLARVVMVMIITLFLALSTQREKEEFLAI